MEKYKIKNQAIIQSKYTRYFSEEFKRAKVKELEQKQITIPKLVTLYGVCRQTVYNWLYQYSMHYKQGTRLVVELESESKKTERLLQRACELERIIGQKQIEIDYLNKLIEISSDELGLDLKKNFSTKHSNGSE